MVFLLYILYLCLKMFSPQQNIFVLVGELSSELHSDLGDCPKIPWLRQNIPVKCSSLAVLEVLIQRSSTNCMMSRFHFYHGTANIFHRLIRKYCSGLAAEQQIAMLKLYELIDLHLYARMCCENVTLCSSHDYSLRSKL